MTVVAIIACEAIFVVAAVLWGLLSILLGATTVLPRDGMIFFVLLGAVASILLCIWKRIMRTEIAAWSPPLLAVGFTAASVPLVILGSNSLSPVALIYLYAAATCAFYGLRALVRRVTLTRKEEISIIGVRLMRGIGLLFFVSAVLLPFYFMFFSSITPRANFLQDPVNLVPRFSLGLEKMFDGYVQVMTTFSFGRYILNSLIVSLATVVLTLVPATLGAYAVTRLRFRGREFLSKAILLIYLFPAIVLALPLYSVFASLGLRDSLLGLLVVYPAITIPVSLYMLRNYFQTLPSDIEEAGIIDGCSRLGVIWRITIPLSLPALLSVGLYIFMIAWNEFLFAFMFLDKQVIFTLPRGVVSLNAQEVPRQYLMAGAIITTIPVMAIFFGFERFLTSGLTAGGVKG